MLVVETRWMDVTKRVNMEETGCGGSISGRV